MNAMRLTGRDGERGVLGIGSRRELRTALDDLKA
jgi:hypothetical protein